MAKQFVKPLFSLICKSFVSTQVLLLTMQCGFLNPMDCAEIAGIFCFCVICEILHQDVAAALIWCDCSSWPKHTGNSKNKEGTR